MDNLAIDLSFEIAAESKSEYSCPSIEKKDRFQPQFMNLVFMNLSSSIKYSYDENLRLFCRFSDLLQMVQVKKNLQKSILSTRKCKILELRGFAQLDIYFKNYFGISSEQRRSNPLV